MNKLDLVPWNSTQWSPAAHGVSLQQTFAGLGVEKEKFVIVSGIGCSSRFPYYMNTYGFHTIHGRAPAVATGVKVANPDLHVWMVTGDGDALSIGGNHLIHAMRRNLNIKVMLFNNRIYGLTKGQYSPTSDVGTRTGSTPMGSLDAPFNPIALALGAGASFVARTVDTQIPHMKQVLQAAHEHEGFAFIEILQNCVIFNNNVFEHIVGKEVRDDRQVDLRPGQPMVFGKEADKGLRFLPDSIEVVAPDQADVWDPTGETGARAFRICQGSERGEVPVPMGIFRQVQRPQLEQDIHAQVAEATAKQGEGTLEALLSAGDTWNVS